jgi:hypothetical protein
MKTRSPRSTPIVLAFATLMSLAATSPAWAQEDYGVGRQSMREKRDAARAKAADAAKATEKAPALYPQAARQEPEGTASKAGLKALQEVD